MEYGKGIMMYFLYNLFYLLQLYIFITLNGRLSVDNNVGDVHIITQIININICDSKLLTQRIYISFTLAVRVSN